MAATVRDELIRLLQGDAEVRALFRPGDELSREMALLTQEVRHLAEAQGHTELRVDSGRTMAATVRDELIRLLQGDAEVRALLRAGGAR